MSKRPEQKVHLVTPTVYDKDADVLKAVNQRLSAQAQSPKGAAVQTEATAMEGALTTVTLKTKTRTDAEEAVKIARSQEGVAYIALIDTVGAYDSAVLKVAGQDRQVCEDLGAPVRPPRAPRSKDVPDAPTHIVIKDGPTSGSAIVKWDRPRTAGAFVLQYRLDPPSPAIPGAPLPEWSEGILTKTQERLIEGLPPGCHLRIRVRSVGVDAGPWSEDVLGRAR